MRPRFDAVIERLNLLNDLKGFRPAVIGTPPLGIDIDSSDIDVACCASSLEEFEREIRALYGHREGFVVEQLDEFAEPAVRAHFSAQGWSVELFCQCIDVENQQGYRHFAVEKRLLDMEPRLRPEIVRLKQAGLKTEPAFAELLGLRGNPFDAVLQLESGTDEELNALVKSRVLAKGEPF